jgi:hypothetical protein
MKCRTLSVNKINDIKEEGEGKTPAAASSPQTPYLRTLEDTLHNRISKKKVETQKYHEIAETEKIWTEIETLQWVLSVSGSIRRWQQGVRDTITND